MGRPRSRRAWLVLAVGAVVSFMGWAQAWAGKMTPEAIRNMTTSDPHSYRKYRVNGVVRNIDAWYSAFGIKPGDALYIAPDKRARIW